MTNSQNFYQQLKDILAQESVVVATVVKTVGSAPREVGAKMAVCSDGRIIGTVGGGAGEGKVIEQALTIANGEKRLVELDLTGTLGQNSQGVCGGKVHLWLERWSGKGAIALVDQILNLFESGKSGTLVTPFEQDGVASSTQNCQPYLTSELESSCSNLNAFTEIIQPPPVLLIVGGGHIAVSLAQIASFSGFQVVVQDDRPGFVTDQRFPQATFLSHSIAEALDHLAAHSQRYIALVTRGYSQDVEALQTILQRSLVYQYIGAIGSQKRIRLIRRELEKQGISVEQLTCFHAPIGLDIGALTPPEIAVSICAELIKVYRGGTGLSLSHAKKLAHVR